MTLVMRDGTNTPRTISEIVIRDGTNTPRTISEIRVRDSNNVSRVIYSTAPDLSASAEPPDVFGIDYGTGTANSNETVVTASGGAAPYTYAWTVLSHTSATPPTVDSPTAAATTFTQTGIGPSDYVSASFQCLVTDDNGTTAPVVVTAFFYSGLIP
jgi:hypothetical protein